MHNYADANKCFPGFRNNVTPAALDKTKVPTPASWVVVILPFMDNKEKYDYWSKNIYTPAQFDPKYSNQGIGMITALVCPSMRGNDDNLNYGVNTGQNSNANGMNSSQAQGPFLSNRPEEGVCLDQYVNPSASPAVKGVPARVSVDYVETHDGTTNTILLGENCNNPYRIANNVHIYWNKVAGASPYSDTASIAQTAENWGINWKGNTPIPDTTSPMPTGYTPKANVFATNEKISSFHTGDIAVVSFCDGSQANMRLEIDGTVFARLLMPYDRGGYAINMNTPKATIQDTKPVEPLDESSFRQ
jgi:hypothetical protein